MADLPDPKPLRTLPALAALLSADPDTSLSAFGFKVFLRLQATSSLADSLSLSLVLSHRYDNEVMRSMSP